MSFLSLAKVIGFFFFFSTTFNSRTQTQQGDGEELSNDPGLVQGFDQTRLLSPDQQSMKVTPKKKAQKQNMMKKC